MKKIIVFICLFFSITCIFAVGCKTENPLYNSVSELRSDLFEGSCENITLKACYGFKETPYQNDAKAGERVYSLIFRLIGKETEDTTYSLSLDFNSQTYNATFKLNPVTHSVTASVEIENFNLSEFSVTVSGANQTENVVMKSTLPNGTMNYKAALDHLYNDQSELIKAYTDENGDFNAEIYARVVVKNQKPYWYIGIASGNGNLKALLVDGFTGEILAIREIF